MVATGNVQLALYMGGLLHVGSNTRTIVLCWSLQFTTMYIQRKHTGENIAQLGSPMYTRQWICEKSPNISPNIRDRNKYPGFYMHNLIENGLVHNFSQVCRRKHVNFIGKNMAQFVRPKYTRQWISEKRPNITNRSRYPTFLCTFRQKIL